MEPLLLAGSGTALLIIATLLRLRLSRGPLVRPIAAAVVLAGTMALTLSSVALASHTQIVGYEITWTGSPWNGKKVYLSSPRHVASGQKGECGWEENINGRHWNYYAASVNTGGEGSFWDRKYAVTVSPNLRDDGYVEHVTSANNWGADVYIVTHTNAPATGVCPQSASYLLVMYRSTVPNSVALKDELLYMDPALPGGQNSLNCDGLYECANPNATHRAYVELFFHTNQDAVNWFQGNGAEGSGGVNESFRYGMAVDIRLGYPR